MDTRWSKAYLGRVRSLRFTIGFLERKIQDFRDKMISQGGTGDGVKVRTSPRRDGLENRVLKYCEEVDKLETLFTEQYIKLTEAQRECVERLDRMKDGRCKDFLYQYYICGMSEIEYANERGYETTESVRNLKCRALRYFEQLADQYGWKHAKKNQKK